ncbi:hypothetical protein AALB53_24260 [Lachnospiraceae bacterium 47-T17]
MILSLQGCMAVGKTTAVSYLKKHAPYVNISYEENASVIRQIKSRGLDKNEYGDYLEIQKLWIENEVLRFQKASPFPCTVMDFGAEEIEFYTLNYPKTIGKSWDVKHALQDELARLRACMPARILFLDASEETLRKRKEGDLTRSREFFEHHLTHFLPLKKAWFSEKENTDYLSVEHLTPQKVGAYVKKWVDSCIENHTHVPSLCTPASHLTPPTPSQSAHYPF